MLFVFYFLSASEVGGGQESEGNDVMIALPPHLNRSAPIKKGSIIGQHRHFPHPVHYRNVFSKSWIS